MENIFAALNTFLLAIALFAIIAVIGALPIMWLWNYVMPDLFGLKLISFSQALALNFLCACLFKSSHSSSKRE